ncbi:MAG: hypothetical protein ACK4TO_05565 [Candidatus Nitrosotenuis sp.]
MVGFIPAFTATEINKGLVLETYIEGISESPTTIVVLLPNDEVFVPTFPIVGIP